MRSWKLIAALLAIVSSLAYGEVEKARADSLAVDSTATVGQTVALTATINAGASQIVILSGFSGTESFGVFATTPAVPSVSPTGETVTGAGSTNIFFTQNATNTARTLAAYFTCNTTAAVSFFLLVAGAPTATATLTCGAESGVGTATLTVVPPLAPILLTASPNPVNSCTPSSAITVTVRDQLGNSVPNGTPVTFSGSSGLSTTSGSTSSGIATAVLTTSVTSNQTITITATSGAETSQVAVVINCAPAPAAFAAFGLVPAARVIVPPSTGDAGLASECTD